MSITLNNESIKTLPQGVRIIIMTIGWEPTLKLLTARGGTSLYIPNSLDKAHALTLQLGRDPVLRLIAKWGGTSRRLPKKDKLITTLRNQCILHDAAQGKGTLEMAQHYGVTDRTIQRILEAA